MSIVYQLMKHGSQKSYFANPHDQLEPAVKFVWGNSSYWKFPIVWIPTKITGFSPRQVI